MKWKTENLKVAAVSWAVTVILLLVATAYSAITEHSFGIPGIILFCSLATYWGAYLFFRKR
jgi:hypothetical protein